MPEWLKGADCSSAGKPTRVRILLSPHFCGSSSIGRAVAFQAAGCEFDSRLPLSRRCSSVVEHFLGKEEAMGSNPIIGSAFFKYTFLKKVLHLAQNKAQEFSKSTYPYSLKV